MRLAWIEPRLVMESLFKILVEKNSDVRLFGAEKWEKFEELHGSLDQFDGLIMHPGVAMINYYRLKIPERYPDLPFAFVSNSPEEDRYGGVPVFPYHEHEAIIDFFKAKTR